MDGGARITVGADFPVEEVYPPTEKFVVIARTTDGRSPYGPVDGALLPKSFTTQLLTRILGF